MLGNLGVNKGKAKRFEEESAETVAGEDNREDDQNWQVPPVAVFMCLNESSNTGDIASNVRKR